MGTNVTVEHPVRQKETPRKDVLGSIDYQEELLQALKAGVATPGGDTIERLLRVVGTPDFARDPSGLPPHHNPFFASPVLPFAGTGSCPIFYCPPPYADALSGPVAAFVGQPPNIYPVLASFAAGRALDGSFSVFSATFDGDTTLVTTDGWFLRRTAARLGVDCFKHVVPHRAVRTLEIEAVVVSDMFSNIVARSGPPEGAAATIARVGLRGLRVDGSAIRTAYQQVMARMEGLGFFGPASWNLGQRRFTNRGSVSLTLPVAEVRELASVEIEIEVWAGVEEGSTLVAIANGLDGGSVPQVTFRWCD